MGPEKRPKNIGQQDLEQKTLEELRALARTAGLQGYSGLRKKQLIELLNKPKVLSSEAPIERSRVTKKTTKTTSQRKASSVGTKSAEKTPAKGESSTPASTEEQRAVEENIEISKFVTTLPGNLAMPRQPPLARDLGEDIDRLPGPTEPVLCLLPQKPGVVHAYWSLPLGTSTKKLRLRLCRLAENEIELLQEVDISADNGHWYFQLPETDQGSLFAQLGNYDASGKFTSAIRRGIARIPTLSASDQIDRRWWIGEEEFRQMYQRAGGLVRDKRFTWPGLSRSSRYK